MVDLTPEQARIFRVTHIQNVPWILTAGLHCKSSSVQDPGFVQIGNPELIDKRARRAVPTAQGGMLNDYVPFYFTPFSPMLYNIKSGWNGIEQRPMRDIVLLTSTLHDLATKNVEFAFTDRHAYLLAANFSDDLDDLGDWIDWTILGTRDFERDPNDPGKFERYQAEALAYRHVPLAALNGIICCGADEEMQVRGLVHKSGVALSVASRPSWFF